MEENNDINIMVVDDSDLSRKAIVDTLSGAGYTISGEVSNATQAIEATGTTSVDILIVDVVMPETSGIQLAKLINEKFQKKYVIMISSLTMENVIIDSISNGAMDFIQKPFDPSVLLTSVANVAELVRNGR